MYGMRRLHGDADGEKQKTVNKVGQEPNPNVIDCMKSPFSTPNAIVLVQQHRGACKVFVLALIAT